MDAILTPEVLDLVAGIVAAAISALLGLLFRGARKAAAEKVVDFAIPIAFHVVEEIARRTENKIDDKVALGLQKLSEITRTKGVEPTAAHLERAKLVFQAMHAQAKMKE